MDARKLPTALLVLTVLGGLLFAPPLVRLFSGSGQLMGVPAEVVYLFAVWLTLVVVTAAISVRLPRAPRSDDEEAG
jgi:hypothetical protein